MLDIGQLKKSLNEFLKLHWHESFSKKYEKPFWSARWEGVGELSNRQRPGCYALESKKGIEYIGSGTRRGKYGYTDNGVGGRAAVSYSRWDKHATHKDGTRVYRLKDNWKGIYTVGFPPELGYLVPALEHFLIIRHGVLLRNKVKMSGGINK